MNIKTENISVTLEKNNILKDINIEVDNKEVVGINGPNGSGKSTLLKCIYRVLKPSEGVIRLDDIDIKSIPVKKVLENYLYYHNIIIIVLILQLKKLF